MRAFRILVLLVTIAIRLPALLLGMVYYGKLLVWRKKASDRLEAERLDRLRNPERYRGL